MLGLIGAFLRLKKRSPIEAIYIRTDNAPSVDISALEKAQPHWSYEQTINVRSVEPISALEKAQPHWSPSK